MTRVQELVAAMVGRINQPTVAFLPSWKFLKLVAATSSTVAAFARRTVILFP